MANYKMALKTGVLETKDNATLERAKAMQKNKMIHDQNKNVIFNG